MMRWLIAFLFCMAGPTFAQAPARLSLPQKAFHCREILGFEPWVRKGGAADENETDKMADYFEATGYIEGYLAGRKIGFPYPNDVTLNGIWT